MRVYIDSSALLKRAFDEEGSAELEEHLARYASMGAILASSSLAWIEVSRGIRRRSDAETPQLIAEISDDALSGIAESPVTASVIALARRIGPAVLRSLDAIHLATATLLDADLVIGYDQRFLAVAGELGFRTESPGDHAVSDTSVTPVFTRGTGMRSDIDPASHRTVLDTR